MGNQRFEAVARDVRRALRSRVRRAINDELREYDEAHDAALHAHGRALRSLETATNAMQGDQLAPYYARVDSARCEIAVYAATYRAAAEFAALVLRTLDDAADAVCGGEWRKYQGEVARDAADDYAAGPGEDNGSADH